MGYLLALSSAAVYGAADFLGGLATRRAPALLVVSLSQLVGLLVVAGAVLALPTASPTTADLGWGAAAGLAGSIGVALLYRALAVGTMGVVAPTTAVCAVALPVLVGAATGQRPSLLSSVGIAVALLAIVLVGQAPPARDAGEPGRRERWPPGLGLAFASGVAIGVFYLTIARTSASAGMWPLLAARAASVLLFGVATAAGGVALARADRRAVLLMVAGGALDMGANILYVLATQHGTLPVVVTLTSLYPASTVVLARVVLGERLGAAQRAGIACALAAVVLIVAGEPR